MVGLTSRSRYRLNTKQKHTCSHDKNLGGYFALQVCVLPPPISPLVEMADIDKAVIQIILLIILYTYL